MQQEVAEYAINRPKEIDRDVALRFGCTPAQVRYAREKAERGEIVVSREIVSDELRVSSRMATTDRETMLTNQAHRILAQLEESPEMPVKERAWAMDKVVRIEETLQSMRLVGKTGNANAAIIFHLVRSILPNATEQEVIDLYVSAENEWSKLR